VVSRTDVRELLFTDPRIALRITEQLSARLADLEQRLTDLSCKTLNERLAATLCQLARTLTAPIRLTHHQLAALVGATRERTTTALGELASGELRWRRHTTRQMLIDALARSIVRATGLG
jgi:CRP/FNR family transcriptional regulator, cyclic AMP receptor protein